jgi:hypothetical protein
MGKVNIFSTRPGPDFYFHNPARILTRIFHNFLTRTRPGQNFSAHNPARTRPGFFSSNPDPARTRKILGG